MKKHSTIIFICLFLFFNKKGEAQALPIYSQYMFNEYLINAAYSGTYDVTPVIINHRNQWIGFGESTPKTSSISAHTGLGDHSAIGGLILSDQTFPISRTQIETSYGYHTKLQSGNLILSMALSGTVNMLQFTREDDMTYSEIMNDEVDIVNQENENSTKADMNFGIVLLNDYFDIGLSIRNLLGTEPSNTSLNNSVERVRYIMLHGSYLGKNSSRNRIGIIPSFVIRKMGIIAYNSLFEFDLNLKIVYRNKLWAGMAYRTHEKAICTLIGMNMEKGFIGWSYDVGRSELGAYHTGSHNIAIGFHLSGKENRRIRNQHPYHLNINNNRKKFRLKKHKSGI